MGWRGRLAEALAVSLALCGALCAATPAYAWAETLDGVDIASYQAGIDGLETRLSRVETRCDARLGDNR